MTFFFLFFCFFITITLKALSSQASQSSLSRSCEGRCQAEGEPTVPAAQLEYGRATPGEDCDHRDHDHEDDHDQCEDEEDYH